MLSASDVSVLNDLAHRLHEWRAQNIDKLQRSSSLGGAAHISGEGTPTAFTIMDEQSPEIRMQWPANEIKTALGKITLRTVFMSAIANHLNSNPWIQATVFAGSPDEPTIGYDQRYIDISTKPYQNVERHRMTFNQLMSSDIPNFHNY